MVKAQARIVNVANNPHSPLVQVRAMGKKMAVPYDATSMTPYEDAVAKVLNNMDALPAIVKPADVRPAKRGLSLFRNFVIEDAS